MAHYTRYFLPVGLSLKNSLCLTQQKNILREVHLFAQTLDTAVMSINELYKRVSSQNVEYIIIYACVPYTPPSHTSLALLQCCSNGGDRQSANSCMAQYTQDRVLGDECSLNSPALRAQHGSRIVSYP